MKDAIPRVHNNYESINLTTCIGFSEIPEQVREKSIKDGFYLNLLVVSRRGLGASTLVNSLFSAPLVEKNRSDGISTTINDIIENGIRLTISVTTYHGEDITKIFKHINSANEGYFEMEQGLCINFPDKRIHCCLYLVPSDQISESEIEGLKELSSKVNVIPVITKADMFTDEELREQREKINHTFKEHKITFYDYQEDDNTLFPLSVVASEKTYDEDGCQVRGRRYAWGFVDIENEKYSDFKKLQRILIYERFVDLVYRTDTIFYDKARKIMMKNENPGDTKQRLIKLLEQMENVVDEKYAQKIQADQNEMMLTQDFGDVLSFKNAEASLTSE